MSVYPSVEGGNSPPIREQVLPPASLLIYPHLQPCLGNHGHQLKFRPQSLLKPTTAKKCFDVLDRWTNHKKGNWIHNLKVTPAIPHLAFSLQEMLFLLLTGDIFCLFLVIWQIWSLREAVSFMITVCLTSRGTHWSVITFWLWCIIIIIFLIYIL